MKFPHRLFVSTVIGIAMLAFFGLPQAAFAKGPESSYYQFDPALETHSGEQIQFASLQGKPVIVSMFYGSCPHVCPMLINTIQLVEKQLDDEARARIHVLMVTVDPKTDDPGVLADLVSRHRVDGSRWQLARTIAPADTRALASVLGIKYKALPDGHYNHTSAMILLDEQGREVTRSGKLGKPDPQFVERVRAALKK